MLDGDAYTGGWEDSDCDEDGDAADAVAVDDEALDLSSIPESQDDQLLKLPGERRMRRKENLMRRRSLNHKTWTYDCLSYKTFRDEKCREIEMELQQILSKL